MQEVLNGGLRVHQARGLEYIVPGETTCCSTTIVPRNSQVHNERLSQMVLGCNCSVEIGDRIRRNQAVMVSAPALVRPGRVVLGNLCRRFVAIDDGVRRAQVVGLPD